VALENVANEWLTLYQNGIVSHQRPPWYVTELADSARKKAFHESPVIESRVTGSIVSSQGRQWLRRIEWRLAIEYGRAYGDRDFPVDPRNRTRVGNYSNLKRERTTDKCSKSLIFTPMIPREVRDLREGPQLRAV